MDSTEPLPTTLNPDGKSLYNPPGPKSTAYDLFPQPIDSSNNGFDFHSKHPTILIHLIYTIASEVYYMPSSQSETKYAKELHERIRREFPEVDVPVFM